MIPAPIPLEEELRLQDLYYYDILDSDAEKDFDDLLEIVSERYKCPIAAITFIDKGRQWFKAKKGTTLKETSRDIAFCSYTILGDKPFIIPDASKDKRFFDNPIVVDHNIKFYAGVPIISQQGFRLGSVCMIDVEPKDLTEDQTILLTILSNQVSKLLELRLKNRLLRKKMEEQMEMEKSIMRKTISRFDQQKILISNEIQENIAQSLAATNFYLELAKKSDSRRVELIDESKRNISDVVNQLRELSVSITPSTLQNLSLKYMVEDQVVNFQRNCDIHVSYQFEGIQQVDNFLAVCVYRAVQEQLKNVLHHSDAKKVRINLSVDESLILLGIEDDGTTFNPATFKKGVGLNEVIMRVEQFGGNVMIGENHSGGCKINIRIPLRTALVAV